MEKSSPTAGSVSVQSESEGEEQDEPSSSVEQISEHTVQDELTSFRHRWQQEIQSQPVVKQRVLVEQSNAKSSVNYEDTSEEGIARTLFTKGIESEKSGKLYEAIQFYRKAVQIVPDIEFKLDYRPKHPTNESHVESLAETHETEESDSSDDDDGFIEDGQLLPRIQKKVSKTPYLCIPKFEQNATHISSLPIEIILCILKWVVSKDLDLRSLEMFGSVCRGFYLCSRDPEIWRLTCLRIWGLNCGSAPAEYGSWRNMFIERPRLNFNGCYISKTTYIRHGENNFQDQFYRPWHLVAYYRYLRFFPDGIVLMLTSSEDPSQCVAQMKSRQPRQPVLVGYYRLKDDKVTLVIQKQEVVKTVPTTYRRNTRRREGDTAEQTFHMELQIHNHKSRRHVKLSWIYYSVFTRTKQGHESTCTFDLISNRFPPLLFSRVKSFTSESEQPLN